MASLQTIRKVHPAGNRSVRHRPEEALRRDHDELRRTLFEAAHVQRKLCGPRQLCRQSFEIAAEIFPVRDLSGDFVSVFELGTELVFAIGDIAGKGLAAAMWFTHLLSLLQLYMRQQQNPAAALQAINRDLCATQLAAPLTTMVLAKLDPQRGKLSYCNAGHPPAILLRAGGQAEMLRQGGPLLGALSAAAFDAGEILMHPGDTLLAYSDGILESRNVHGAEFGLDGVLNALQSVHGSANATLFSLLAATEDFAGDQPRHDDLALVVVNQLGTEN